MKSCTTVSAIIEIISALRKERVFIVRYNGINILHDFESDFLGPGSGYATLQLHAYFIYR